MSEQHTPPHFSTAWNDASETDVSYSRLSIVSVIAFLFGLASFLIFFTAWFLFLGVIGLLLSLAAIGIIRRSEGGVTGLAMAQTALGLSIVSLVAVAVLWPAYHFGVRREADRFFRIWFAAMQTDNIPLAKGLSSPYWERGPIPAPNDEAAVEKWWKDQYENKFAHRGIHNYVENQLVRTMLALGEKAKVSYYKTLSVSTVDDKDTVVTLYAVSFPTGDGKTDTFFVKMSGTRRFPSGDIKSAGWSLTSNPELIVPDEFKR